MATLRILWSNSYGRPNMFFILQTVLDPQGIVNFSLKKPPKETFKNTM